MARGNSKQVSLADLISQYSAEKEDVMIPTGILTLDHLLGGGINPGSLYSIWGVQGSGKCIDKSTRVVTKEGYLPLSTFESVKNIEMQTPFGLEVSSDVYSKSNQPVKVLSFRGNEVKCTTNHPILIANNERFCMIRTSSIKVGDFVARPIKSFEFPVKIGKELSYWTGCMLGDGFCENTYKTQSLGFMGTKEIVEDFVKFSKFTGKIGQTDVNLYCVRNRIADSVPSIWESFKGCTAATKRVPKEFFKSTIEDRVNLLYGLLDTDGTVTESKGGKSFDITLKSKGLILDIRDICESLGLYGKLSSKQIDGVTYYRFTLSASDLYYAPIKLVGVRKKLNVTIKSKNLWDVIPITEEEYVQVRDVMTELGINKAHRYGIRAEEKKHTTRAGVLLHSLRRESGVTSRETVKELCELLGSSAPETLKEKLNFRFVKIDSITDGVADVMDITLPEHHLFYAAGLLVHNTTLALQIAKSFCKRGEKVFWIDVEKALNKNQQESFGVRKYVEEGSFIHVTANTYVDADKLTTAVAEDNEMGIKLVVVDSESMLLTKVAKDQAVDDSQPGQKARQSAVWLTKMKTEFYEAGIACIVLVHARANINMAANPYAPKEKQAGGFGLLHAPDCIIKVQPGQKFGDKSEPEGQILHIQCEKNKFAKPFETRDVRLWFGTGVKKRVEVIDLAIAQGVITQSGSFFKLPSGDTIRGTEALYQLPSDQLKDIQSQLDMSKI